jgi:hypothetical protein
LSTLQFHVLSQLPLYAVFSVSTDAHQLLIEVALCSDSSPLSRTAELTFVLTLRCTLGLLNFCLQSGFKLLVQLLFLNSESWNRQLLNACFHRIVAERVRKSLTT